MKRYIIFEMVDGSVWKMPADIVVKNAVEYYSNNENTKGELVDNPNFVEEMFEDDYEITDWLLNNMDWKDINPHIEEVEEPKTLDYSKNWQDAEIYVE